MEHDDRYDEEPEDEQPDTPATRHDPERLERARAAYTDTRSISRDEYLDY